METVKIYKITVTEAVIADEEQERYSLAPWGGDTLYYKGYDDGGAVYALPEGYTLGTSLDGAPMIFGPDNQGVMLDTRQGQPAILIPNPDVMSGYQLKVLERL